MFLLVLFLVAGLFLLAENSFEELNRDLESPVVDDDHVELLEEFLDYVLPPVLLRSLAFSRFFRALLEI